MPTPTMPTFIRLDVLARHGGLYADIDTLFLGPIPERCWNAPAVIGREADVGGQARRHQARCSPTHS